MFLDFTKSHLLRAVVPRPLLGALAGVEQGAVVTGRHALAIVGAEVGVLKSKPNENTHCYKLCSNRTSWHGSFLWQFVPQ